MNLALDSDYYCKLSLSPKPLHLNPTKCKNQEPNHKSRSSLQVRNSESLEKRDRGNLSCGMRLRGLGDSKCLLNPKLQILNPKPEILNIKP